MKSDPVVRGYPVGPTTGGIIDAFRDQKAPVPKISFYLEVGRFEGPLVAQIRRFRDVLISKGHTVEYASRGV